MRQLHGSRVHYLRELYSSFTEIRKNGVRGTEDWVTVIDLKTGLGHDQSQGLDPRHRTIKKIPS